MSDILNLHLKQFVKVKVKLETNDGERKRKAEYFTLDPQIANYITLRLQIAQLFQIDGEFSVSFKQDGSYVPLASDFDLDGAISEASDPMLSLAVKLQPIDNKTLEEWDIIVPADIPPMEIEATRCSEERRSLAGSIISQIEFTVQKVVQRAFSFSTEVDKKRFVGEDEYLRMFDTEGRVMNHRELHRAIFNAGGVEPSLRPRVWLHLLNVFPHGMTGSERQAYLSSKCEEYFHLRYRWQQLIHAGTIPQVLEDITNTVRKDACRTDRIEKFYSGSEDTGNVRALFNILTTYAVNHPNTSYVQGMSDLLSPILYVMKKESEAYVCFCGLMKRAYTNFYVKGNSMKLKFRHMQKMLWFYDPELCHYLKDEDAMELLFIYRWLLLDLKREFPFNETVTMMEVLWSSLPPKPPQQSLELFDVKFPTAEVLAPLKDRTTVKDRLRMDEDHFGESGDGMTFSQSETNEDTLMKIKKWTFRVRRESMATDSSMGDDIKLPVHYRKRKYRSYIAGKLGRMNRPERTAELSIRSCKGPRRKNLSEPDICQSWSCGEVLEEKPRLKDAMHEAREFLRNQWCYSNTVNEIQLNNWLNGRQTGVRERTTKEGDEGDAARDNRQRHGSSDSNYSTTSYNYSETGNISPMGSRTSQSEGYESDLEESKEESTATIPDDEVYEESGDYGDYSDEDDEDDDFMDSMAGRRSQEVTTYFDRKREMLPPPHVLGDGNPFLLFLCTAMIMEHRTVILNRRMDFNELGIYFDRLVRKHNFQKMFKIAKKMFTEYLNMGWDTEDRGEVTEDEDY